MILAITRVMALTLLRDRGALAMVMLLPPVIFVVFAGIFSTVSTGEPYLRIGLVMVQPMPELDRALRSSTAQTVEEFSSEAALRHALARGVLDVGLVGRGPLTQLDPGPLLILVDPSKPMAGAVLNGRVQTLLAETSASVLLQRQALQMQHVIGPFTTAQAARVDAAVATASLPGSDGLTALEDVGKTSGADPVVTYYAGAIAMMFLLFSATQSAAGMIDERESGILDRIAAGPRGIDVVVLGRAVFLTAQGVMQSAMIFAVAAVVFGVPVLSHAPEWAMAVLLAAAAAAGVGLACAAACHSRAQAMSVSTFVVLVSSALGGSMVPRFLMPEWLRDLGLITPNAWAVELFQGLLFRGDPLADLASPALALAGLAVAGTGAAVVLSRRRMML